MTVDITNSVRAARAALLISTLPLAAACLPRSAEQIANFCSDMHRAVASGPSLPATTTPGTVLREVVLDMPRQAPEQSRYARLAVELESAPDGARFDAAEDRIVAALHVTLAGIGPEALRGSIGEARLQQALLAAVNDGIAPARARDLRFTALVIC